MSEIVLIMYHLLLYSASDSPDTSNGQSNNNHDPNHHFPSNNNVSYTPSDNHGRCNDCNPNRILPDDNINEFYNATTYNLVICKK